MYHGNLPPDVRTFFGNVHAHEKQKKMPQVLLVLVVIHVALVTGFDLTTGGLSRWSTLAKNLAIGSGKFELVDVCYDELTSDFPDVYVAASEGSVVKVYARFGGFSSWVLHSEHETNFELADLKIQCNDELFIATAATNGTIAWSFFRDAQSTWVATTVGVASEPRVYLGGPGFAFFAYRQENNSSLAVFKVIVSDAISSFHTASVNPSFPIGFTSIYEDIFLCRTDPGSDVTGFYAVGSSTNNFLVPSGATLVDGDTINSAYPISLFTSTDDHHGGCYVNTNNRLRCVGFIKFVNENPRKIFGMNFEDIPASIGSTLQGYGFVDNVRSTSGDISKVDVQVASFVDQATNNLQVVQWTSSDGLSLVVAEDANTKSASFKLQTTFVNSSFVYTMLVAKVDNSNGDLSFNEMKFIEKQPSGNDLGTSSITIDTPEEVAAIIGAALVVTAFLSLLICCKVQRRGFFAEIPNDAMHFNKNGPFDAFLSHDWVDNHHEIVVSICAKLVEQGLNPWLDERQLSSNLALQMAQGIQDSNCFVAFITQAYLDKVNSLRQHDNCRKEFQFAVGRSKTIIPVVLESHLLDTREWSGLVQMELGNTIYINMSTPELIEKNISALVRRINDVPKLTNHTDNSQPENCESDNDDHLSIVVSEPDNQLDLEQNNPGHTMDELDAEVDEDGEKL